MIVSFQGFCGAAGAAGVAGVAGNFTGSTTAICGTLAQRSCRLGIGIEKLTGAAVWIVVARSANTWVQCGLPQRLLALIWKRRSASRSVATWKVSGFGCALKMVPKVFIAIRHCWP